jgi:hypothetical protein
MGLVSVDRDWPETARYHANAGWTSKEFIDVYNVEMSLQSDGPEEILKACQFMNPFQTHPKINDAMVLEPRFERHIGLNSFKVEVEYSTEIAQPVNPLSLPAVITGSFTSERIIRLFDFNGKAKMNMAGDFFTEPAPEITSWIRVYKVTKNVPTQIPAWTDDYINCVNSDVVTLKGRDWQPGTVLYIPGDLGADDKGGAGGNVPFLQAAFELHCKVDGWKTKVANVGFREIVPLAGKAPKLGSQLAATWPMGAEGFQEGDEIVGFIKGKSYVSRKITIGTAKEYPAHAWALDKNGRMIPIRTIENMITLEFDDYDKRPFNLLPLT